MATIAKHALFASPLSRKMGAPSLSCRIRSKALSRKAPKGSGGFGYDPVFFFPQLGRTYAEITREEKNQYSHRGRAFRKAIAYLEGRVL